LRYCSEHTQPGPGVPGTNTPAVACYCCSERATDRLTIQSYPPCPRCTYEHFCAVPSMLDSP
jgi:hypothetical protein